MSRAYTVRQVQATARVEGGDTLALSLCLLDILEPSEMSALLREELAALGWRPDAQGELSIGLDGGAVATLARDASEVTLRLERLGEVSAKGASRSEAEAAVEAARARAAARASERAARELDAQEPALRAAVGEAVQRVYVRALKRRAASMGQVESVDERVDADGELELTIRVRV
ncbi:MAG: hypothetical protein R3A48_09285 [Polyangiales bacterium]